MANPEHLDRLKAGTEGWNQWREQYPFCGVDLRNAELSNLDFNRGNLSWASLDGVDFSGAHIYRADFRGAILNHSNLNGANLFKTNLQGAQLVEADIRNANLIGANLREANLTSADLRGADLNSAELCKSDLVFANLSQAVFYEADLTGANLRSARLQYANLDYATITDANLWETQRHGWSVKSVVCERVYWARDGSVASNYTPGEFEKLYAEQLRIELFYDGGITEFEVNTLPALLNRLAVLHPDCGIRLRSIEETGGGAKVSMSIETADFGTRAKIASDAERLQAAQIALRDDHITRLEIERRLLLDEVFPRMIAATGQNIHIAGPATGVMIAGGQSSVHAYQALNDSPSTIELLNEILHRRSSLDLDRDMAKKLERAVRDVQSELQKAQPRHRAVFEGLKTVKDFIVGALGNAVGTALATNTWGPLLDQLTRIINSLPR